MSNVLLHIWSCIDISWRPAKKLVGFFFFFFFIMSCMLKCNSAEQEADCGFLENSSCLFVTGNQRQQNKFTLFQLFLEEPF